MKITPELYKDMTERSSPSSKSYVNIPFAFLIGGGICLLGEALLNLFEYFGMEAETAGSWTSVILVFLSALFTGLGWYEKIAKHEDWVKELLEKYPDINAENIHAILQKEVGLVFVHVLEDAGVYKCTPKGREDFMRFVDSL